MTKISFHVILSRATPYLINTLFDAVFTILGIIVGSSFSQSFDLRMIIGTMVTVSISLGVSSGFSVYEAESIQEEKRINEIEEALLNDLDGTIIIEESKMVTFFASFLVFLTPLIACIINLLPVFLVYFGLLNSDKISIYIIIVDLTLIFLSGLFFGEEKRLIKAIRMTILGSMVFLFGFLLSQIM